MYIQEEGIRLREEVNYQKFYPDLNADDLVVFKKEEDTNDSVPPVEEYDLRQRLPSWKQLYVNDTVTVEKLGPQIKHAEYKQCNIQISQLSSNVRVNKQLQKYGFRSHGDRSCGDGHSHSYCKKTDLSLKHRNNVFADISPYQSDFRVEYDMDEQDDLYLRHLNSAFAQSKQKISHELFEIVITILENEAFHLEKKIPPRVPPNATNNTHESHAAWKHHELYGSDDGTGYPNDQPCAVCGSSECDNSNAIIFCDGCNIAVHQECYGVVFIPEGQWLCRRCMISKNRKVECMFCPSTTGAFKQTDNGSWGHVLCGLWIPELYFGNLHYMEPIGGIENIPKSRWKLTCYICGQEMGACIQCSNKNCFLAYHPTCAKRAGLYMKLNGCTVQEAASKSLPPGAFLESYCHKHCPKGWGNCEEGIRKTRDYFKHVNQQKKSDLSIQSHSCNHMHNHDHSHNHGHSHSHERKGASNKWKTKRGTLIAPQAFVEITQKVLSKFRVPNAEHISADLCKYWTMKRELKRGAPLVRKFSPSSLNTLTTDELNNRISFSEVVLEDLGSLESIASSLVSKHKCNVEKIKNLELIENIAFHPVRYMLKDVVWNNFSKMVSFKSFLELETSLDYKVLSFIQAKIDDDAYPSIQAFREDFTNRVAGLTSDTENSRSSLTLGSKLVNDLNRYLSKIDLLDVESLVDEDFEIDAVAHKVQERAWKGRRLMEREDLSDVEDLTIMEERQLKGLMRG